MMDTNYLCEQKLKEKNPHYIKELQTVWFV